MRFMTDRCIGRGLGEWLRDHGHDVLEARTIGPDPGDRALLDLAVSENRILITSDKDFGEIIYLHRAPHSGLIRLPDVSTTQRIDLLEHVMNHYPQALEEGAIVTIRGSRVRISRKPQHES